MIMIEADAICEAALFCILLIISVIDVMDMKIYNRHIAIMSVSGIIARITLGPAGWTGAVEASLFWGAAGALVLLLIRILSRGGLGGGDVKLGMAIGIWMGSSDIIIVLMFSFMAAGVFGLLLLLLKGQKVLHMKVPFGPFLSAGALLQEMGFLGFMTLGVVL